MPVRLLHTPGKGETPSSGSCSSPLCPTARGDLWDGVDDACSLPCGGAAAAWQAPTMACQPLAVALSELVPQRIVLTM